jgi:PGF-pre-PGF domain-containing protein
MMNITPNDEVAPRVTVNKPSTTLGEAVSSFYLNITTIAEAAACSFNVTHTNSTSNSDVMANHTQYSGTISTVNGVTYCIYQASRPVAFKNANYSLRVNVTDSAGNSNVTVVYFNVSDNTNPKVYFENTSTSNVSVTSTGATTIINSNEYINATVRYGSSTSLGSTSTDNTFDSKVQTIVIGGLTENTQYYYNFTVCDYAGNCVDNNTLFTFTTSDEEDSSGSSSSSSGSAGGATVPTADKETVSKQWATVAADENIKWDISNDKIAVRAVLFETLDSYSNVGLDVSSIDKPTSLTAPSGLTYQYLDIDSSNLPTAGIKSAKIQFRIPFTWFNTNNVKRNTVELLRYNSGWKVLATKEIKADSNYAYYEATTPGFSYFVIRGKVTEVSDEEVLEEEDETAEVTTDVPVDEEVEEEAEAGNLAWLWWTLAIVIVLIAAVVAYVVMTKKEDSGEEPKEESKEEKK